MHVPVPLLIAAGLLAACAVPQTEPTSRDADTAPAASDPVPNPASPFPARAAELKRLYGPLPELKDIRAARKVKPVRTLDLVVLAAE